VRVEVEGLYSAANTIAATKIRFVRPSIRFQAPVAPADVVIGQSITILGKLVKNTPQLRDEDGIIATGLATTTMVEVRAYMDVAGNLQGVRVRNRNPINLNKFKLRGLPTDINGTTLSFKILGININGSTSVYQAHDGTTLTAAQFFTTANIGRLVGIEDASYNTVSNTLSGGTIKFEDDDVPPTRALKLSLVPGAQLNGTILDAAVEMMGASGFE
jgi:hypothetical protein